MKTCKLILLLLILADSIDVFSQVAINSTGVVPDGSSMLDVSSTTMGILIPRVALTASNAAGPVTLPQTSLLVYNTATASSGATYVYPGYYYNAGTTGAPNWVRVLSNKDAWNVIGNDGTTPATNFVGTTDDQHLQFRTNNLNRMRIMNSAYSGYPTVGIGTIVPVINMDGNAAVLHVHDGGNNVPSQLILSTNSTTAGVKTGNLIFAATQATNDRRTGSIESSLTAYSGGNASGDLRFFTNNANSYTEKMRIISNGNVGIGLISPTTNLEIVQNGALKLGNAYLSSGGDYVHLSNNEWYNGATWTQTAVGAMLQLTGQNFNFYSHAATGGAHTLLGTINATGFHIPSANAYLNFNATQGATGYGFRDNAGILEYKHSGGIWSPFAQPPIIPGNTEWWVRPTAALYIQPMYNAFARVYDNGQNYGFYYEGNNANGAFFRGSNTGAIGTRSDDATMIGFTSDQYPFTDVGGDYAITSVDRVTWTGLYGYGASYNGITGIGELDNGVRGIGLGMSMNDGTNSSWPVCGVMGEVIQTGNGWGNGQQGVYGWQAAPAGAGSYDIGVLGRTSQTGTQSAGVAGYYNNTVGSLVTCFSASNYGMLGTSNYGGEFSNGVRLYPGAAPSAQTGAIYYNSGTNIMYYYNGSAWTAFGGGGGDNLGNHTATNTLSMSGYSISNTPYVDVTPGDGYGIQFWSSGNYAINMGNLGEFHYGPVWDYSIKMNMNNQAGRGWTWGVDGSIPVAGIECTSGNMQIAGSFGTGVSNNVFQRATRPIGYSDSFDGSTTGVMISNQESEEGGYWANGDYTAIFNPGDNDLVKFIDEDWFDNAGTVYDANAMKARIDPNGQYFQISDLNQKNNILKIQNALAKINQMNGYTYDFNLHPKEIAKGQKINHSAGIIAQEMENVFPEAVSKSDGSYMVNYAAIIPVLIEAIKEQQKQINSLQEKINKLEEKNN